MLTWRSTVNHFRVQWTNMVNIKIHKNQEWSESLSFVKERWCIIKINNRTNIIIQIWHHKILSSLPTKPHVYAKNMASILGAQTFLSSTHRKVRHYTWRVLDFIELEAEACSTSITTSYSDGQFFVSTYSTVIIKCFIIGFIFFIKHLLMLYLGVTHVSTLSSLHSLSLCCIIDLLQIKYPLQHVFVHFLICSYECQWWSLSSLQLCPFHCHRTCNITI